MNHAESRITPKQFWEAYREAYREKGSWETYQSTRARTALGKDSARRAIERFGLRATKEWFRIDYIGDAPNSVDPLHNWFLHVVFDHENAENWSYELGSHVHIASDLSVIVSYWKYNNRPKRSLEEVLQEKVLRLKRQMLRVPDRQWLFAFGPTRATPHQSFAAFTVDLNDPDLSIQRLNDEGKALAPSDWPDFVKSA